MDWAHSPSHAEVQDQTFPLVALLVEKRLEGKVQDDSVHGLAKEMIKVEFVRL